MAPNIETLRTAPIIRSRSFQTAHSLSRICIHHTVSPSAVTDLTALIDSYDENTFPETIFATIVETCPQLRALSVFRFITTVQPFEEGTRLACQDLEVLRVVMREIKCPDQVDACLAQLKNLRSGKGIASKEGDGLIGDTVIKKLIKLQKLKTVWLGTGDVHLDPH
ncbi:hypothetical protein BGZ47_011572 [Haplosporangium gracile]|nr:hypothetical protein BGZ47_011572 [Haplosporangium gracile]